MAAVAFPMRGVKLLFCRHSCDSPRTVTQYFRQTFEDRYARHCTAIVELPSTLTEESRPALKA